MTKNFRRNIERVFCYCRDLKTAGTFSKFNKRGGMENFLKLNKWGARLLET